MIQKEFWFAQTKIRFIENLCKVSKTDGTNIFLSSHRRLVAGVLSNMEGKIIPPVRKLIIVDNRAEMAVPTRLKKQSTTHCLRKIYYMKKMWRLS